MSLAIWPSLPPAELQQALETTQRNELAWLIGELGDQLQSLKTSLDDCYKLLGPDGRGNTLVLSTRQDETVKGYITRLGTQIVKGTVHLRLRTLPAQTIVLNPENPITIEPLDTLNLLLVRSMDLLDLTLSHAYPTAQTTATTKTTTKTTLDGRGGESAATFLAAQLRVLAQALHDASALLEGPPQQAADPAWATRSAALAHFAPPLSPALSFYVGLQDSQLVVWLRALEPAAAPVNLGMKFALAIGTARRLEHEEADQVFAYCCEDGQAKGLHTDKDAPSATTEGPADVFVRERIRVESGDPSLMSLSSKLHALSHTLAAARKNLAAVMGEEMEE